MRVVRDSEAVRRHAMAMRVAVNRCWVALLLVCCGVWMPSSRVRAQPEPSVVTETQPRSEAELEQLVTRAVAAYDAGDLTTARALFEAVHAQRPTARTLRSLGLLAYREERIADAIALLEAALASQVRPLTEAQRQGAITLLNEARGRLPAEQELAVTTPPPAAPPSAAEVVAPTAREVAQSAAAPQASATPAPAAAPLAAPSTSASATRARRLFRARYGLLGAGAGALLFSLASYATGLARLKQIENACKDMQPDGRCFESERNTLEKDKKLDLLEKLALAGAITGGAAVTTGGLLFLWRPSSAQDSAHTSFRVAYQGAF